jgi:hypothetical protein
MEFGGVSKDAPDRLSETSLAGLCVASAEGSVQAARNEHHTVKKERRSVVDASLIHVPGHRPRIGGSCVEETSSGGHVTAPAVSAICPAGENIAIWK